MVKKPLPVEAEISKLREENELLGDLLKAALKRLGSISFEASSEAEGIEKSLDELIQDL